MQATPLIFFDEGAYPRFSRDGSQLLYSKLDPRGQTALWLASIDGKSKRLLVPNAFNGSWSPDGSRLACCRWVSGQQTPVVAIYDIRAQKVFDLVPGPLCGDADILWTRNARSLLYDNHGLGHTPDMIDLDTLKSSPIQSGYESAEWFQTGMSVIRHPKTRFHVQKSGNVGVWAINRDGSFERRLVEGVIARIDVSPSLERLALEWPRFAKSSHIYLTQLISNARSRGDLTFRAAIQRNDLISSFRGQQDAAWFDNRFKEWQQEGTFISGAVYSPRVNPLNGKTIGPGDKVKAWIRVLEIGDDHLVVKVVSEMSRPTPGDVLAEIQLKERGGSTLLFAGKLWGVLTDQK